MAANYSDAVSRALNVLVSLFVKLALPLAMVAGALAVAAAILLYRNRTAIALIPLSRVTGRAAAWTGVLLLAVAAWAGLRAALPVAVEDVRWRESKEATSNPAPDAPPIEQYGPSLASLTERTYTRTLTLPPTFLDRVGTEGLGVIAPYMTDPSAENILRLVDTFRRSGRDVVFTRAATRMDEEPIPLLRSAVNVRFKRLAGRAYEAEFEGRYVFTNAKPDPIDARLSFPLPGSGTVRDVSVTVGGETVSEPAPNGAYEWKSRLEPGEQKEAVARYRVVGARSWQYDLGSQRRRVQQFRLEVAGGGPVKFRRGSLQPTSTDGKAVRWDLTNVVTAQRIAIELPPDSAATQCYLQSLAALPIALVLFLIGAAALLATDRHHLSPGRFAAAVVILALGLASTTVLTGYVGPITAMIVAPVAGALGAAAVLAGRSFLITGAALVPAAFLSPEHTGLIVLLLALTSLAAAGLSFARIASRPRSEAARESTV